MADYLYGELLKAVEKVTYEGLQSQTATVIVDNDNNTILVDVLDIPAELLSPKVGTVSNEGRSVLVATVTEGNVTYSWLNIESYISNIDQEISDLNTALQQEITRATDKENELQNLINEQSEAWQAVTNQITQQLNQEITDRQEADQGLQSNIDSVSSNLATNYYSKSDVDGLLSDKIDISGLPDNIVSDINNTPSYNIDNIELQYNQYYKEGSEYLPSTEGTVVQIASATASSAGVMSASDKQAIDQGVQDIQSLYTNLSTETSQREAADESLSNAISTETQRATQAEQSLSTSISNETQRATQAEQTLTTNLSTIQNKQVATETGSTISLQSATQPLSSQQYVDVSVQSVSSALQDHTNNTANPHQVTAEQVGLGNVDNVQQYSAQNPPPYPVTSVAGRTGAVTLTKSDVGLSNVDNTSDVNKPISTATQAALDSKVGNSGEQSITGSLTIVKEGDSSGNLVVQGNLTVQGTTVTESAETLAVKDNLIITNSDGATLTDFSGLAIRTDSTNVYGIVYDSVHDSVDLGLGQLDTTNNFTFNDGEGYPVAVRDYSSNFTDGHIIAWDAASRKLVDGGPKQEGGLTSIEPLTIGDIVYDGTTPQTVTVSDIGAEPAFTKNTAFNKNFGTAAGTVMQGNDSRVTSAVQSVTFAGAALTKSGTALSITQSDARTALGLGSAAYSDASSFATQTQGSNADTALAATQTNASAIQDIVNGTTTVGNATNAVNANTANSATTASTASNATNVTTNINGKAISSIFESDGVTVKKATTATSATSATTATSANTATSATKATQDGNGNVITSTYATIAQLNTTNTNVTNASNKATPLTITESTGNTSGSTGHTHSLTLTKSWLATDLNADSSNVLVLYGGNANGTW